MNDAPPQDDDPIGDDSLRAAEALLERRIGLDAESIGGAAITRALRTRMTACGVRDATAFVTRLTEDADECDRLVDEVVVPETWFFRDPQVFDFVQATAGRLLRAGRAPVRILCVPCASGEEPYSVAMALFDAGLSAGQFAIDAADVSRTALARAAEATYSSNAFRGPAGNFRQRWFHDHGTTATLFDVVRRQVRFAWGNLLDESFIAGRDPYQLILCRNLLIYLSPAARGIAARAFDRLLAPDGLLVVGAAEPPILSRSWVAAAGHSVFALQRASPPGGAGTTLPAPPDTPLHTPPGAGRATPGGDRVRRPFAAAAPAAVTMAVPEVPTPTPDVPAATSQDAPRPGGVEELLREAGRLAHDGCHEDALRLCRSHLEAAGPCPQVFFLMGMLHQAAGDLDRAEEHLQKAIYLDAHHDEALLALAIVAKRRGDEGRAERYRLSAARALIHKGAS